MRWILTGLGLGLAGAWTYGLFTNLYVQFVTVGFGAVVLTTLVIWGTYRVATRPWVEAMGSQRITNKYDHSQRASFPGLVRPDYGQLPPGQEPLALPGWATPLEVRAGIDEDEEVVA